ncbi:hypothetical protein LRQ08_29595 (plasmid) [Rhodococcus qingshengii]|uniref:hypothetical protein n=1 Tax=Rhodococcus qingshengii TaxID=334542 RepID=UPI002112B340|nr:hypothetical protein [Rhodococcus qingshengii]UUE28620.1 hypothetical protein LRQ08_29595 [Rhodococcus qingshengii]
MNSADHAPDWATRIAASAQTGSVLHLGSVAPDDVLSTEMLNEYCGAIPTIPASAIRAVIVGEHATFDPRGLRIHRAHISGYLDLDHIDIDYPLHFVACTFDADISLKRAKIPELALHDSHTQNINLNGTTINGDLYASKLTTHGEMTAVRAQFDGSFDLEGAVLHNPGKRVLTLNSASVDGGIYADKLTTYGEISAIGVQIGSQLELRDSQLNNPDGTVITLDGATVTRGVYAERMIAKGVFNAPALKTDLDVNLHNATINNGDDFSLFLQSATIGQLILLPAGPVNVNLGSTKIATLVTPENAEPAGTLIATGWELGDIHGKIRTDHRAAHRWIDTRSKKNTKPQPWQAIATVYERNGHPDKARRMRFTAANKVTRSSPHHSKPLRWLYLAIAGHGYYPLIAVIWLAATIAAGFVLVETNREHFIPTSTAAAQQSAAAHAITTGQEPPAPISAAVPCELYPDYPCFDATSYTLNTFIPTATGVIRPDWAVHANAPIPLKAGLPALRITAWILTALIIAGVTGLLRKH